MMAKKLAPKSKVHMKSLTMAGKENNAATLTSGSDLALAWNHMDPVGKASKSSPRPFTGSHDSTCCTSIKRNREWLNCRMPTCDTLPHFWPYPLAFEVPMYRDGR